MTRYLDKPWSVKPLHGKYYGTVVNIGDAAVRVWMPLMGEYRASDREIADGWEPDHGFDHVETQDSYEVALLISSAPELLRFARQVVAYAGCAGDDYLADKARQIIAKATGVSE